MPDIAPAELRRLAAAALTRHGCAPAEAEEVALRLVEANLMGHDSHGVQLVPLYIQRLGSGMIVPGRHAVVVSETEVSVVVDGGRGMGQVVGREAAELGIRKAKGHGVAVLALREVHHLGRVGAYAEIWAAAGLASISFVNVTGARLVAPHGGIDRRFGTNPFTCGIPGPDGQPFILDMATSEIAAGKVAVARKRGKDVPSGCLIDTDGRETTDPNRLYEEPFGALLPFGAHKGFAISMFCELLAGALTGSVGNHPGNGKEGNIYNNMLSILIDVSIATSGQAVLDEIRAIEAWVRSSRPRAGSEVLMPGEPERRALESRSQTGIPVEQATWLDLNVLAGERNSESRSQLGT